MTEHDLAKWAQAELDLRREARRLVAEEAEKPIGSLAEFEKRTKAKIEELRARDNPH